MKVKYKCYRCGKVVKNIHHLYDLHGDMVCISCFRKSSREINSKVYLLYRPSKAEIAYRRKKSRVD